MIAPEWDRLLSFQSVHEAIRAQDVYEKAGLPVKGVPTPRDIDISCGVCLLYFSKDEQQILSLAQEKDIEWSFCYDRSAVEGRYTLLQKRLKEG